MTELYLLNIEEELPGIMIQELLDILPKERQERISKYRFPKDARRSIFSGALMNYIIYLIKTVDICI